MRLNVVNTLLLQNVKKISNRSEVKKSPNLNGQEVMKGIDSPGLNGVEDVKQMGMEMDLQAENPVPPED